MRSTRIATAVATCILGASSARTASGATVFSETFGGLTHGTAVSDQNTNLSYVRTGSGGGGITIVNPSPLGSGASALIQGPSNTSLNGIGVTDGLVPGASTVLS